MNPQQIQQFIDRLKAGRFNDDYCLRRVLATIRSYKDFQALLVFFIADFDQPLDVLNPSYFHRKLMEQAAVSFRIHMSATRDAVMATTVEAFDYSGKVKP